MNLFSRSLFTCRLETKTCGYLVGKFGRYIKNSVGDIRDFLNLHRFIIARLFITAREFTFNPTQAASSSARRSEMSSFTVTILSIR